MLILVGSARHTKSKKCVLFVFLLIFKLQQILTQNCCNLVNTRIQWLQLRDGRGFLYHLCKPEGFDNNSIETFKKIFKKSNMSVQGPAAAVDFYLL